MQKYYDDYRNMATIEEKQILPYRGAKEKQTAFVLSCYALYDNNMLYFLSCYETETDALAKLEKLSCGTFKRKYN